MPSSIRGRMLPLATALCLLFACQTTTRTARVAPEPAAPEPAAPEPAAAAEEESYNNTIKWSTASEVDNFGFDVFRGDSPEGPFERLNAETIEGAGTSDEPSDYRYVDDTIDPHRTYYYYVESISMDGVRERFTPVGKAGPKIKPETDETDETDEADVPDEADEADESGAGHG